MNPMLSILSSTISETNKRCHDGIALNMKLGGMFGNLRKHKVDLIGDTHLDRGSNMTIDGGNRLLNRTGSLNNEWLGLWKEPQQNPFNIYGTLPSKTRCREKRKAFSVPPFEDMSDMPKDASDISCILAASKLTEECPGSHFTYVDQKERRMVVPPSLEMQRISTILSEPKSTRTSLTASTARSTIDSFRYSDPFDECFMSISPMKTNMHLERLLNNLYMITQNGFLSGCAMDGLKHQKDHVDAEFIAMTLAKRQGDNPCLRLLQELEDIVAPLSKHRRPKGIGIGNCLSSTKLFKEGLLSFRGNLTKSASAMVGVVRAKERVQIPLKVPRNPEFLASSKEDILLWNASNDIAKEAIRRSGIIKRPVKYDLNDDFMVTDADDYAVLQTRFGRIIYSPKFSDGRYIYRFVILTKEAQEAVETLSRISPKQGRLTHTESSGIPGKRFLTEYEIVRQLGIQMSPGWEHFMYFKSCQKELILRKRA